MKIFKILLKIIIAIIAVVVIFIGYLTLTEFKPGDIDPVDVEVSTKGTERDIQLDDSITVVAWNIGYAGLGAESDFFMDGGEDVKSADENTTKKYLAGISETIDQQDADLYMLQEIDQDSSRSYNIAQEDELRKRNYAFALNYSCPFVPYPLPPIGKVNSGVMTTTDIEIEEASRISLPNPFKWPVRIANLKRCMLVSYMPIAESDSKLVVVNFHLEAYDSGEGKIAQTKKLIEFVEKEYEKGNYVIAGGDWNQTFPGSLNVYPNNHEDLWKVGLIDTKMIPRDWNLAYDVNTPTCRLLNQPYDPVDKEDTQYYVIDGFLCSPNVKIDNVKTIDEGFENSDHNPVRMQARLLPAKEQ